jgi:hypothetical protein
VTAHAFDAAGWFIGEVADDTPGSTPIAPPEHAGEAPVIGEAWPRWHRFEWRLDVYAVPVQAPVLRHITPLAFIDRFTDAEWVAFDLASIGATAEAAGLRRYLKKVDRPDTRVGVLALEESGLLAEGRALQILDAPVQPHEQAQRATE